MRPTVGRQAGEWTVSVSICVRVRVRTRRQERERGRIDSGLTKGGSGGNLLVKRAQVPRRHADRVRDSLRCGRECLDGGGVARNGGQVRTRKLRRDPGDSR